MTSPRAARCTTKRPAQAMKNAKNAALPHWPGETHARLVAARMAASAMFVGLKRCLPFQRRRNLLEMAMTAAAVAIAGDPVRRRRHSESAEIKALHGSKTGRRKVRVQASCAARAVETTRSTRKGETSNESAVMPYSRRTASEAIWKRRGSFRESEAIWKRRGSFRESGAVGRAGMRDGTPRAVGSSRRDPGRPRPRPLDSPP